MTLNITNTISDLIQTIYSDNENHIDFMDNMNGGDCDCHIHATLEIISDYCGITHTDLD